MGNKIGIITKIMYTDKLVIFEDKEKIDIIFFQYMTEVERNSFSGTFESYLDMHNIKFERLRDEFDIILDGDDTRLELH